LGQLPFSVLPTARVKLGKQENELFSNYRQVPWLIRKVAITRLPSVSSLITLRKLPEADPGRKVFAGFGDPFFNKEQLARAEREKSAKKIQLARLDKKLNVRGIRITRKGNLDRNTIASSRLESLNRLPDTADEIKGIAEALNADPARDIFLGKNATEQKVKTMDLSDRRIIAFATHALIPGDLDGLDQPALAFSSPKITGSHEDGLLTVEEILKLKLNADWVILSACNTGAAHGVATEAYSGLGRSFFYAGTRAILVSMWPVETTSAQKLIIGLFKYQKKDKTLSRAKAFRNSMLDLIDEPGLKESVSGRIISSYAHPLFWAPFIIVGESGSRAN
jgi:CHAT domain-containing protein